jgi:multiple sugar transport system permease protein
MALLLGLFCLGPFLWQISTSLKPAADLLSAKPLWPANPTAAHYQAIFRGYPFGRILLNSFIVASLTTLISLAVGSLAAFALAKLRVRQAGLLLAFILSASMFPPIATVSPLYILIRALHLRDTLLALVLTYTTFALPLTIWLLTNYFQSIPEEIYLASRVDGCTPRESFLRVILPLSAPGLFATALLVFIFSWNEFLFALTFTSTQASRTIPVAIALFPGLHEIPWGEIAAASVVAALPVVGLALLFQGRIVEGLTAGALKG